MTEEMKSEAVEVIITACEKFGNDYFVSNIGIDIWDGFFDLFVYSMFSIIHVTHRNWNDDSSLPNRQFKDKIINNGLFFTI